MVTKHTTSKRESYADIFTAPYRSYRSSEKLHAYDAELNENFKQMGIAYTPRKKGAQAYDGSVYTPVIADLESKLNDISTILNGQYRKTQKRDAWKWEDRASYVTQKVQTMKRDIADALARKELTTQEAAAILEMAKTKIDIRYKNDKRVVAEKIDEKNEYMRDAYRELNAAIRQYQSLSNAGKTYVTPKAKTAVRTRTVYKDRPATLEALATATALADEYKSQANAQTQRADTEQARADNLRAESEAIIEELEAKKAALADANNALAQKAPVIASLEARLAQATNDVADTTRQNAELRDQNATISTQLENVTGEYAGYRARAERTETDLHSRLLAANQTVSNQREALEKLKLRQLVSTGIAIAYGDIKTAYKNYQERRAAQRLADEEYARTHPPQPPLLKRLGVGLKAAYERTQPTRQAIRQEAAQALRATGQAIANVYRPARQRTGQTMTAIANHPHVDKGARYVAGAALAAAALIYAIKNDSVSPRPHLAIDDNIIAQVVEEKTPAVAPVQVQTPQVQLEEKAQTSPSDNQFSLLNLSKLLSGETYITNNYYFGTLTPLAPQSYDDETIVITKKDIEQIVNIPTGVDEHTPFPSAIDPNQEAIDDGTLDLSPKAREQFYLLERNLDRVGVFTDGKRVSFGSAPYLKKKYPNVAANTIYVANFDTARSPNASRDFTEKESVVMMLDLDAKVAKANISVPDSNNSEYADFIKEAIAHGYMTAEQTNRLTDLAEVNARTRIRRFLGIPFLPLPLTKTTDGRTVEVHTK